MEGYVGGWQGRINKPDRLDRMLEDLFQCRSIGTGAASTREMDSREFREAITATYDRKPGMISLFA
ncbi:hypothetical protein LJK88_34855 [Paenibacillus sp. P26]|nr:hypothetical protein LJK88_34855 [Paenibacillus sp. P26]UUZ93755.1 hypothetical protein LJK87_03335 [Paenibacillus sp. P25]